MKQSIGLKAAIAAIQNRYHVKEGLARRLARAEAEVLKKVYPQWSALGTDEILEQRYASVGTGINFFRDITIPNLVPVIMGTPEAAAYQTIVREVINVADVPAEDKQVILQEFDQVIHKPDAAQIEADRARMAELLRKVPEMREAFEKYEQGLMTREELFKFRQENEMVNYRLVTGDYGEEAEEEEFLRGEPTKERWLEMRGGKK